MCKDATKAGRIRKSGWRFNNRVKQETDAANLMWLDGLLNLRSQVDVLVLRPVAFVDQVTAVSLRDVQLVVDVQPHVLDVLREVVLVLLLCTGENPDIRITTSIFGRFFKGTKWTLIRFTAAKSSGF